MNLEQLYKILRTVSGMDEIELPDEDALAYLNKAYFKILDEFDFRQKERTTFFDTVAGTESYELPVNYEAVQHLAIVDTYGKRVPLKPLTRPIFDANYQADSNYYTLPTGYTRERNNIRLQPIPDAVYRIYLNYWLSLADLAAGNDTPDLPRAWHEIIELGAKYRLLGDLGDREGGIYWRNMYDREIATLKPTSVKEKADNSLSGLEVLGRDYDQRY